MRTILLLLAALVTIDHAAAQHDVDMPAVTTEPPASFYAMVGTGRSDIFSLQQDRIADVDRIDNIPSLALRAGITLPLGSVVAMRPEITYARKGVDLVEFGDGGRSHTEQVRFDYVTLPLLVQFTAPVSSALQGHLAIGPYGAWLMRSTVSDLSPVDAGITLEAGVGLHVLGLGVLATARLDHGMVPLGDDDQYLVNRDLTFNIGISLP